MDLEEILNIQRKEKYNRKNPDKGFKGQYKQDEYVYNNFFTDGSENLSEFFEFIILFIEGKILNMDTP